MKKIFALLMAAAMFMLVLCSCGKEPEFIGEFYYFGNNVNWEMTIEEAYSYASDNDFSGDGVSVTEKENSVTVQGGITTYNFNGTGRLTSIYVSYGEDRGSPEIVKSQLGEPDYEKDGVFEWYGTMGGYATLAKFQQTGGDYCLSFSLRDEELAAAAGVTLMQIYEQVKADLENENFENTVDPLYFLQKINYKDSKELYEARSGAWMARDMKNGDYASAWPKRFNCDDDDLIQECAYEYSKLCIEEGTGEKLTEAAEILEEYCAEYKEADQYLMYIFARTLEQGNALTAYEYYKDMRQDMFDVPYRIAAFEPYLAWDGDYMCVEYSGPAQQFEKLDILFSKIDDKLSATVTAVYLEEIAPVGGMYSKTYGMGDAAPFQGGGAFSASCQWPKCDFEFSTQEVSMSFINNDGETEFYRFAKAEE